MAVDLDGTYIRGNTLRMYIKAGSGYLAKTGRFWRLLKVLGWVFARRLKLISHVEMKVNAAKNIGWNEDVQSIFRLMVLSNINPTVQSLMREFEAAGGKCVIASAAFGFYIPAISALPFVATDLTDKIKECRGEEKCHRLSRWLNDNGYTLHSVVTDHKDDIPLLRMSCVCRYLVSPSADTIRAVDDAGIKDVAILR